MALLSRFLYVCALGKVTSIFTVFCRSCIRSCTSGRISDVLRFYYRLFSSKLTKNLPPYSDQTHTFINHVYFQQNSTGSSNLAHVTLSLLCPALAAVVGNGLRPTLWNLVTDTVHHGKKKNTKFVTFCLCFSESEIFLCNL